MGSLDPARVETGLPAATDSEAGVTRMDLVCSSHIGFTARDMARRWGRDRALSPVTAERLLALIDAAVGYGLRFGPRGVTIMLRWLDPDRMRVDVKWRECSGTAISPRPGGDVESTAATFDALAEAWGFVTTNADPLQWIVLDTR